MKTDLRFSCMVSLSFARPCYCSKGRNAGPVLKCVCSFVLGGDQNHEECDPWWWELWHKSLEFTGVFLFIRRATERSPVFYNPSLSQDIIRVLTHCLGYPITLVLLLVCCFFLYLLLSRLSFSLICCVTFVKMKWIVINYEYSFMLTTTLTYGKKKWPV